MVSVENLAARDTCRPIPPLSFLLSAGLPLGTAADAFGQGDGRAFTLGWAEAAAVGGVVVSPPGGALVGALSDLRLYLNQPGSDSGGPISQLYHVGVSSAGATKQNATSQSGERWCVLGGRMHHPVHSRKPCCHAIFGHAPQYRVPTKLITPLSIT